jgi:hypothetical protein
MTPVKKSVLYCITFKTDNELYRLHCRKVLESSYYGFLEVRDFVFRDQRKYVIEPQDEKVRREFGGLTKITIPFHSILRIDEYEETEVYSPFLKLETSESQDVKRQSPAVKVEPEKNVK